MGYAPRILVVDDELNIRVLFEGVLSEVGYNVTAVGTARLALAEVRNREFDVMVLDLSLPDRDGIEIIRQIRAESVPGRILAISGFMVGDMPDIAIVAGASATLLKPTTPQKLLDSVYRLLDLSATYQGR